MIDPAAVAVQAIGKIASSAPSEKFLANLPVVIVETISAQPTSNGDPLSAVTQTVQLTALGETRAQTRDTCWQALAALTEAVGQPNKFGSLCHVAVTATPFEIPQETSVTDLHQWVATARMTVQENR